MTDADKPAGWIPELEIENAQIKWAFSHFDGREDTYNDEGDHNFTIILDEAQAQELLEQGWNVKYNDPREEGDPGEWLFKVKISYKFEEPRIYLIKNGRKFRASERDLADITRAATERVDVIIQPSRWVNGARTGVSAYTKELYATVKASRFSEKYAELEEV